MEYRYLGRSGLMVSALSLGGWVTYGMDLIHHVSHSTAFSLHTQY